MYSMFVISLVIIVGSVFNISRQKYVIYVFIALLSLCSILNYPTFINRAECFVTVNFLVILLIVTWGKDLKKYVGISVIIIVLMLSLWFIINFMKVYWGRVRFYNLNSDYSNYTPWYVIRGNTGHRSFPSGHVVAGWTFFPLVIYINRKDVNVVVKWLSTIAIITWGILIGLGRIIGGQHYASDVLFSTGIVFVLTILMFKIINGKRGN